MNEDTVMDIARLEALADAYGGDLRRWPDTDRASAEALLAREPSARARLDEAARLDDLLALSTPCIPGPALRAQVIASAPRPRRSLFQGVGFWLSGAGLAAAGVAGVLVGAAASGAIVREAQTEAVLAEVLPDEAVDILPLSRSSAGGLV